MIATGTLLNVGPPARYGSGRLSRSQAQELPNRFDTKVEFRERMNDRRHQIVIVFRDINSMG